MSHSDWSSHVGSILGAARRPFSAALGGAAPHGRDADDISIMRVVMPGDRQLMIDIANALRGLLRGAVSDLRETCAAAGGVYYTYKISGYEQELTVDDVIRAVRTVCAERVDDIYVDCEARAIAVRVLCGTATHAAIMPQGARAALHVSDMRKGRRLVPRDIGGRSLIRDTYNEKRLRATVEFITQTIEEQYPSEGVNMRARFVPVTSGIVGLRIDNFRRRVPLMFVSLVDRRDDQTVIHSVRFHPRDGYLLFHLHANKRRRETSVRSDGGGSAHEPGIDRDYMAGRRIVRAARRSRARTPDNDDLSLARLFETPSPPPSQRGAALGESGSSVEHRPRRVRRIM